MLEIQVKSLIIFSVVSLNFKKFVEFFSENAEKKLSEIS